ncbi:tRNA (carboxymethyluridine(34)-5-O)-methyltransferase ALKBH8-like [Amphiura filiformis]|uniref:tRNA (carboxymethyluridine(34)-5-O)-methyltransferase ALKBH8-like n=1 Tax=Amphiura filiformis TaxID=82378 RepID=UPI003B219B68
MASAESQEKKKLSKAEKKAARKQAKSQHLLLKHDGIATSETPTKFLLIGNGGLLNGIQQELLAPLFKHYGQVEEIVMLPGKPYSFVCYREIDRAIKAHDNLQGYVLRDGLGPTNIRMYLSYVTQVPKNSINCENLPAGLILIEDFIDQSLERELLESITWEDGSATCESQSAQQSLKHRRVKHHGYEFLYSTNNIDKDNPMPDGMPALFGQVIDDIMATGHVQCRPDQLTINQYQPGQGIPPHIDTHSAFEDAIIALSLGSQVLMEFSHPDGRHIPVLLSPRSLVTMTGEARYLWSHGITPRKGDIVPSATTDTKGGLTLMPRSVRTSLTFRAIRREPCKCDYPSRCDSQQNQTIVKAIQEHNPSASLPTSEQEAAVLEQTHVHQVYDRIAEHFSDTRHKPWPRVAEFLNKLAPGSVVMDVGCGNGKYLGVNRSLYTIGCDRSQHLVDICRQRQFQAFTSDALELPVRSASVDACICIAVIHHFSTQARREKAVQEIVRILNSGGQALIYVWAVEQERNKKKSNYLKDSKTSDKVQIANNGATDCEQEAVDTNLETERRNGDACLQKPVTDSSISNQNSKVTVKESHSITASPSNVGCSDTSQDCCKSQGTADREDVPDIERRNGVGEKGVSVPQGNDLQTTDNTLPIHKNRTQFVQPDLLVPWHLKIKKDTSQGSPSKDLTAQNEAAQSVVYHRYYHVFKEGELEKLCLCVGDTEVVSSYYDQGNWCVVFKKK